MKPLKKPAAKRNHHLQTHIIYRSSQHLQVNAHELYFIVEPGVAFGHHKVVLMSAYMPESRNQQRFK